MKRNNLTLIEILGVAALIVILLTIGIGTYTYASDSAKEKATKATVARIANAMQQLQDKGLLKKTTADTSANGFVTVKFDADGRKVSFGGTELSSEAFKFFAQAVDADSIDSILDENKLLADGWGQKFLIRYPGKFNRGGFDIISAGSDGVFGDSSSDSVPPADIANYKDSEGELICDDISNFF